MDRQVARVKKNAEVRKNEFLDSALALFLERGYEATTINDVIERVGVSKGAFYHHYSAKEDLLEGLALRFAAQALESLDDILNQQWPSAVDKVNAFLAHSRQLKTENAAIIWPAFKAVFLPRNIVLYHRLNAALGEAMTPILAGMIAEGVEQGVFDTPDPEATAQMILRLGAVTHDAVARIVAAEGTADLEAALAAFERRLQMQGFAIDRLLGLRDGTIRYVEPGFARAVMAGMSQADPVR